MTFRALDPDVKVNETPAPRLKLDLGQTLLEDRQPQAPQHVPDFDPATARYLDVSQPVRFPVGVVQGRGEGRSRGEGEPRLLLLLDARGLVPARQRRARDSRHGALITRRPLRIALAVWLAGAAPAAAQDPAAKEPAAASPRRSLVTAAREETRVADTPASVAILPRAALEVTASSFLDDALRQVVGFSLFRRTSSRTANPTTQGVSLRGLGASGASRALVLADGVPLNDPFGSWVYWARQPRLAVERLEVLRGGGADLYGSGALGGVVQLVSRDARAGRGLEAELSAGGVRDLRGSAHRACCARRVGGTARRPRATRRTATCPWRRRTGAPWTARPPRATSHSTPSSSGAFSATGARSCGARPTTRTARTARRSRRTTRRSPWEPSASTGDAPSAGVPRCASGPRRRSSTRASAPWRPIARART